MLSGSLTFIPITVIYLLFIVFILFFCEVGFRIGRHVRNRQDRDAMPSVGPMVGGVLGMLGFLLALTFSMALAQHDNRKQSVLDEANIIGTAYLRADLLDSQHQQEVKQLLSEYVDVRLDAAAGGDLDKAISRSIEIHGLLWEHVVEAANSAPGVNNLLVIESINDLIDMHEIRVTSALRNRIPDTVWSALIAITALSMITLGMQVGLSGKRRFVAIISLSLAFATLVTLVVDLNRPQSGLINIGQDAMISLQKSFDVDDKAL